MNKIIIKNVYKSYGKNKALDNLSISINSGEIFGIVGPNGSGKSTLFKILSGMIDPNSGIITYNKVVINKESNNVFGKMGVLIEEPTFYTYLTGEENLKITLKLHGLSGDHYINKVNNIIDIKGLLKIKYKKYSMGMKQKLGIASAIVHNPEVIILDEPTNSLDITAIDEVKKAIRSLKYQNKIVIISSHVLSDIQELCDRGIIIKDGKIIDQFIKNSFKDQYYITVNHNDINILNQYKLVYKIENDNLIICSNDLNYILDILKSNNISIIDINKKKDSFQEYVKERMKDK